MRCVSVAVCACGQGRPIGVFHGKTLTNARALFEITPDGHEREGPSPKDVPRIEREGMAEAKCGGLR